MNDNTIIRIKVPSHLYESVKKKLTLVEAPEEGSNESLAKALAALQVSMEKMEAAIKAASNFVYGSKKDEVKEVATLNETEEIDLFIKIGEWTVANFPKVADEMVGILRDKEALTDLGQFVVTAATAGTAAISIPFIAAKKTIMDAAKKLKDMAKAFVTADKGTELALTEETDDIISSLPDDMVAKLAK